MLPRARNDVVRSSIEGVLLSDIFFYRRLHYLLATRFANDQGNGQPMKAGDQLRRDRATSFLMKNMNEWTASRVQMGNLQGANGARRGGGGHSLLAAEKLNKQGGGRER